jgi:5-formyltetrahydrofolate cyclo-ligase
MTDKRHLRTTARAARAAFIAHGKPQIAVPEAFLALLFPPSAALSPVHVERSRDTADQHALLDFARSERAGVRAGSQPPILATYAPLADEADPAPLARAALAAGWTLALPHVVDRATPLRFLAWHPEDALAAGPFGLSQPASHAPEVAPDIILTPLVAFDAALNRIGQGAGHYDRAFAAHPHARRIGVAFSVQQVQAIAADPWDMPLDAIVTETGWIT